MRGVPVVVSVVVVALGNLVSEGMLLVVVVVVVALLIFFLSFSFFFFYYLRYEKDILIIE